jgi:hypothetical protein
MSGGSSLFDRPSRPPGEAEGQHAGSEWEATAYRWRPHREVTDHMRAVDAAGAHFRIVTAWDRPADAARADAVALWTEHGLLGADVRRERADQLVSLAYDGDRLAGVTSVAIQRIDLLRGNFAMFRDFVAPAYRRRMLAAVLLSHSRAIIDHWSALNPDAGVLGLAAVVEGAALREPARLPRWTNAGLDLAGWLPDGRQLRVAWFDHGQVEGIDRWLDARSQPGASGPQSES